MVLHTASLMLVLTHLSLGVLDGRSSMAAVEKSALLDLTPKLHASAIVQLSLESVLSLPRMGPNSSCLSMRVYSMLDPRQA